jgi:transposase-like protein
MGRMTRSSAAEKLEIIRIVEESALPVKQTLAELDVPRSTFYRWYERYLEAGYDGLVDRQPQQRQFWNRIPQAVREQVVQIALEHPEQSPRELAWTSPTMRVISSPSRVFIGFSKASTSLPVQPSSCSKPAINFRIRPGV